MGMCSKLLRITWHPVVLSFSFTGKELRNDPWVQVREQLEQLDIKYSSEYEPATSHVITKKRNTSKGLQALINGKYIATDTFITAVVEAATTPADEDASAPSALERDFDGNWPNPLKHLPPRGEEPSDRPVEAYGPDDRRLEVFDDYTFVFYEQKQYETLFPVITTGKGKALLKEVSPGETDIDDFIRYVKGVAGEKGLGSFEDGSEGRGVVVVRYLPAKGADFDWFADFLTSVALRLDHRPIDQREFLEAILACDATMLRRPLEEESQPASAPARPQPERDNGGMMEVDQAASAQSEPAPATQAPTPATTTQRRGRTRRAPVSRFKGFDLDDDDAPMDEPQSAAPPVSQPVPPSPTPDTQGQPAARRSQRKRAHSPIVEESPAEIMDGLAPTAAAVKRRRIEAGEAPVPISAPEPEEMDEDEDEDDTEAAPVRGKGKAAAKGKQKAKEDSDILERARQHREEEEARIAAERQALDQLHDDGIDYAAIRRMQIVEECTVRLPDPGRSARSSDKDGAERWDPRWNGRPNFKKFRRQGEAAGRQPAKVIVGLQEVKTKEYGIGDDYWLEDEGTTGKKKKDSQRETQTQCVSQASAPAKGKGKEVEMPPPTTSSRRPIRIPSSDEDEEDDSELPSEIPPPAPLPERVPTPEPPRTRTAKAAERASTRRGQATATQSQATQKTQTQAATRSSKRVAAAPPAKEKPAKKPRRAAAEVQDSEESEDEPRFRFGRR